MLAFCTAASESLGKTMTKVSTMQEPFLLFGGVGTRMIKLEPISVDASSALPRHLKMAIVPSVNPRKVAASASRTLRGQHHRPVLLAVPPPPR